VLVACAGVRACACGPECVRVVRGNGRAAAACDLRVIADGTEKSVTLIMDDGRDVIGVPVKSTAGSYRQLPGSEEKGAAWAFGGGHFLVELRFRDADEACLAVFHVDPTFPEPAKRADDLSLDMIVVLQGLARRKTGLRVEADAAMMERLKR